MNRSTRSNTAERFGRWLGRSWRGYMHSEQRAVALLAAHRMSAGGAKALLWVVKLVVLGVLLYIAFWLALLLLFMVVVAMAVGNSAPKEDEQEPEWRMGISGYGLYRGDVRIDPGSPDD